MLSSERLSVAICMSVFFFVYCADVWWRWITTVPGSTLAVVTSTMPTFATFFSSLPVGVFMPCASCFHPYTEPSILWVDWPGMPAWLLLWYLTCQLGVDIFRCHWLWVPGCGCVTLCGWVWVCMSRSFSLTVSLSVLLSFSHSHTLALCLCLSACLHTHTHTHI